MTKISLTRNFSCGPNIMTTKEAYAKLKKPQLLERCADLGIRCPQRLSKSEIIDLLVSEKIVKSTTKKPLKAQPKIKGGKGVAKKVGVPKKRLQKPSVITAIPVIQTYLVMGRQGKNVSKELQSFLDHYDWSGGDKLRQEVEAMIASFTSTVTKKKVAKKKGRSTSTSGALEVIIDVTPPKKKMVVAKAPKYVPGEYESMEILSVQFGKKGEVPPPVKGKKRERISITLEELRKEVDKPAFITSFTKSSKDLMGAKVVFYKRRLDDARKEYYSLQQKVKRLRAGGIAERTIEDMYPGYPTMGAFIIDLEELIKFIEKREAETNEKEIKQGLIEAIDDTEEGIASLIGRDDVKNQLASQLYSFSKGYKTFIGSFNNIAIYGIAGVGKTVLAKVIAFAFSRVGILAKDTVKIVTRTELVGQYIGQTAPRTRSVLVETLEGVLFIDEAYQLTACPDEKTGSKDFGGEAITEIVNFLDKYIGMSIVIVAGYEGVMSKCFMTFNEGLPRRFPYRYILSPYSDSELTDILVTNLKRKVPEDVKIDAPTSNFLFSMIVKLRTEIPEALKNQAGDMLNLSAQLNKSITSSFKIKWKNGDLGHNIPILLAGFDEFLNAKGYSVYG
jgi:hypothetical protein